MKIRKYKIREFHEKIIKNDDDLQNKNKYL
jgi:hypothetical protein